MEIDYTKRLNNMLIGDVKESVFGIDKLIKSEIISILKNYLIISSDDVDIEINATNNSRYDFVIKGSFNGIKRIKKIN